MRVIKRTGKKVKFDPYKVTIAILSALNATKEGDYQIAEHLSKKVVEKIKEEEIHVEDIQNLVEKVLMMEGYHETAKAYILYREEHKQLRNFDRDLIKDIARLSKETNRDNANIGHCIKFDGKLIDYETGKFITIQEVVNNKKLIQTLSLNDNKICNNPIIDTFDSGIKECYKVTTRLGKELECTANHPLLTFDGWKKLEDLHIGSRIGVPSKIKYSFNKNLRDCEIKLLGYLIGDGGLSDDTPNFTQQNEVVLNDFYKCVNEFGNIKLTLKHKTSSNNGLETLQYRITRIAESGNNTLTDFLNKHKIYGKKSYEKFVPEILFQLSKEQIKLFLSALWATDGCLSNNDNCAIVEYYTTSKQLAKDVQHLLLRLGIIASIKKRDREKTNVTNNPKSIYIVGIYNSEMIRLFCDQINVIGKSNINVLQTINSRIKSGGANKNTLPSEARELIIEAQKQSNVSWKELSKALNYKGANLYNAGYSIGHDKRNRSISKDIVLIAGKVFNSQKLIDIATSDIYWDEIVSIEPIGKHQTYDISIQDSANFIVNDFFVHNSPASKMYQIGATASKAFYINRLLPKSLAKLQKNGDIHIHDFDYYDKTFNCLSIPLEKMLKDFVEYDFEYGTMRSPKTLTVAMIQASIILQRISNDIFGGTMLPNIDITIQNLVDEGYIIKPTLQEIRQSAQALLYNLATMATRAGNQIPFSSITFGLETNKYGKEFSKAMLEEFKNGMGKGETFIFPNLIFKAKAGVNLNEKDPNYDLYDLAVEVSCGRMNPTFNFLDVEYYQDFDPKEVNVMGCRTHVIDNINGEAVSEGRGNIFPTTINLPRLAIKAKGINYNKDLRDFFKKLTKMLDNVKELSMHRWNVVKQLKAKDIPFVMGQEIYYGSVGYKDYPEETIERALKQGTIAIGYVGIAECVKELIGEHHGESQEALELALSINKFIREYCDQQKEETGLNWSCYATPAESTINKVFKDRKDFGIIEGVTDRDYYTNSFHIPVYHEISIARKITIEGLFHPFNNGGRISYIELTAPPIHNKEGIKQLHKHMVENNIGYAGINFPIDECRKCSHYGIIKDVCPKCGNTDIKKIRRVSGYLGFSERINESKGAEIDERFKHDSMIE